MTACIVGWSHGKFGKLDGETSESLIVKAASEDSGFREATGAACRPLWEIGLRLSVAVNTLRWAEIGLQ